MNSNIIIELHEFLSCDTYLVSTNDLVDSEGDTFHYEIEFHLDENKWVCTLVYDFDTIAGECPADLMEEAKRLYVKDDKENVYDSIVKGLRIIFDTNEAIDIARNISEEVYEDIIETAGVRYSDSDIRMAMARVLIAVTGIGKN